MRLLVLLVLLAAANGSSSFAAEPKPAVEVLHFWTSGGEAGAIQAMKEAFEKAGGEWIDVPVAGGGGGNAQRVLKARIVAGNPPSVSFGAAALQEWGEQGLLADVDDVARAERWDERLPALISERMKHNGRYAAVPTVVERANMLYVNPATLSHAGVTAGPGWPRTWEEFNTAADALQKAGVIPLAHGGQPWQDVILFQDVALGIGGPAFYRKALIEQDPSELGGPTMIKVFDQMRKLKSYTDRASSGRSWNLASGMVMRGEAAMQLMGTWTEGEFAAAGKKPGEDFLCVSPPGAGFIGGAGGFTLFKVADKRHQEGQRLFAKVVMSEDVQQRASLAKGAIPSRLGVSQAKFGACARKTMADLASASAGGATLPTIGASSSAGISAAITDVVTRHFNSDMASTEAAGRLVKAVQDAK